MLVIFVIIVIIIVIIIVLIIILVIIFVIIIIIIIIVVVSFAESRFLVRSRVAPRAPFGGVQNRPKSAGGLPGPETVRIGRFL